MPSLQDRGQSLAVAAEALYLVNLLLAPGIGFVALLALYVRNRSRVGALALCHLQQTVAASVWAGVLLLIANGLILVLGGYRSPGTWVVILIYFTVCHATLVLLGALGLSRAIAGQCWRYPLVGRPLPPGCAG